MWKKNNFIFLVSLAIGFAIGLFVIGWWLFPVEMKNGNISDLRTDLKIDYVKLVADSYASHQDIDIASKRLSLLDNPQKILEQALLDSTGEEKNRLLLLQAHLPEISEANAPVETSGNSTGFRAFIGYGLPVFLILILALTNVKGEQWQKIIKLWKSNLWKTDLFWKRIAPTILLIAIYRFASQIPFPGINQEAAKQAMEMTGSVHEGFGGFLLSMDVLAGGTLSTFSVLSIGIYAYLIAQMIVKFLFAIVPALKRKFEDEPREKEKVLGRWTPRVSLFVSIPLSFLLLNIYSGGFAACMGQLANPPDIQFGTSNLLGTITIIFELIAAGKFAEWLTGLISEVFWGMGPAIIIASGSAVQLVRSLSRMVIDPGTNLWGMVIFILAVIVLIFLVICMQMGRRNIPVMYPGRSVGNRMAQPVKGVLPLTVGLSGIYPILYVQAILTLPAFITLPLLCSNNMNLQSFVTGINAFLSISNPTYWLVFSILLIPYTFFVADVLFYNQNYADNMKRVGAQIPGVNRGQPTERYLLRVLRRITLPYSFLLVVVAILPYLLSQIFSLDISPLLGISIFFIVETVRNAVFAIDAKLKEYGYQDSILHPRY